MTEVYFKNSKHWFIQRVILILFKIFQIGEDAMRFKNRSVIVTGSSRGIGKTIALAFAKHGANIVVNYVKNVKAANEVADSIRKIGRRFLVIQADVTEFKQVEKLAEQTLDEFGRIDILINNAGAHNDSVVWKMDNEQWNEVVAVNLTGVFHCTKAVIKYMQKQGYGRIINISSVVGQIGSFGTSNYSASKAGIIGFTKAVAKEVAQKGITVNAVALGYIDIGMGQRLSQEMKNTLVQQIPIGRFGEPKEVAQTVLFLASKDASYITGQVINVNGGYYI